MRAALWTTIALLALTPPALRAQDAPPVDHAALLKTLATDATDMACLFGVPTQSQRDAATHATTPFLSAPIPRDGADAVAHARALLIGASLLDPGDPRDALIERAAATCEGATPSAPDAQVERFVLLAMTELLATGADNASAARAFDHLVDAKSVMRANRAALPRAASLQLQVTCATILAALIERGPPAALRTIGRVASDAPFTTDGRPDPLAQLLLVDLRARAHAHASTWDAACDVYDALAAETSWGFARPARRALALEKLATVLPPDVSLDGLPPIGVLAEAAERARADAVPALRSALARTGPWRDDIALALARLLAQGDGAERCEAAGVLLDMVERSPGHGRAGEAVALACATSEGCADDALFMRALGAAHASDAEMAGRGVLRLRYAQELGERGRFGEAFGVLDAIGDDVEAGEVARVRAGLALARYRSSGDVADAHAVVAQCEALRDAAGGDTPVWCEVALAEGSLATGDAAGAVSAAERAVEALEGDASERGGALRVEALGVLVRGLVELGRYAEAEAALARLAQADERGGGAAVAAAIEREAWGEVEPHVGAFAGDRVGVVTRGGPVERLRIVLDWARGRGDAALERGVAYRLAYAELLGGDAQGAAERMRTAQSVGGLLLLGEAQLASGDDAGAFATLSRLAQSLNAGDHGEAYWHAWTRVLEVLDGQNADGSRSATIRRRLVTIGAMDDGSCPACGERLGVLREKYLGGE